MKLSPPLVSDIGKQSSLSKQSSMTKQQLSLKNMSQEECIEIDSSSDDYDTSGIKRTAKIATKKNHIPFTKIDGQMKKKSYDCSSNDDDSIYSTKLLSREEEEVDSHDKI